MAIWCSARSRSLRAGSRSPAICSLMNWSYGRSLLKLAMTQSRYRQAWGYIMLALPLDSANRARSSQCRPQRSPNRGEASSRSTTFAKASSELSATNARTSSGEGGRPIKSKLTRRIRAWRPASATGFKPLASRADSRKRSISDFGQLASLTWGGATARGGWNAQNCRAFSTSTAACAATLPEPVPPRGSGAPILTHFSKSATTSSGSFVLGGIWSESSL